MVLRRIHDLEIDVHTTYAGNDAKNRLDVQGDGLFRPPLPGFCKAGRHPESPHDMKLLDPTRVEMPLRIHRHELETGTFVHPVVIVGVPAIPSALERPEPLEEAASKPNVEAAIPADRDLDALYTDRCRAVASLDRLDFVGPPSVLRRTPYPNPPDAERR